MQPASSGLLSAHTIPAYWAPSPADLLGAASWLGRSPGAGLCLPWGLLLPDPSSQDYEQLRLWLRSAPGPGWRGGLVRSGAASTTSASTASRVVSRWSVLGRTVPLPGRDRLVRQPADPQLAAPLWGGVVVVVSRSGVVPAVELLLTGLALFLIASCATTVVRWVSRRRASSPTFLHADAGCLVGDDLAHPTAADRITHPTIPLFFPARADLRPDPLLDALVGLFAGPRDG